VTLGDVLQAHEDALMFGGRSGIRSIDLLYSALGRPYSGYYRSIYRKAAALAESLAQNHAFIDGNKRTALLAVDLLIGQSHYRYSRPLAEVELVLEALILDLVDTE
jgi:death on curing protein